MFLKEPSHILLLAIAFMVIFGAKKLPDSARSLGRSLRILKSEMVELKGPEETKKVSE